MYTATPKKPNSALRKVARVRLTNAIEVIRLHPRHWSQFTRTQCCTIRGGRVKNLPGVRYHIVRGALIQLAYKIRMQSRFQIRREKAK